jgi:hypothetical protein
VFLRDLFVVHDGIDHNKVLRCITIAKSIILPVLFAVLDSQDIYVYFVEIFLTDYAINLR